MKKQYCVNRHPESNGDHEVHNLSCERLPKPENRQDLGSYETCSEAVRIAMRYFSQSNGCYYCSRDCNTQ